MPAGCALINVYFCFACVFGYGFMLHAMHVSVILLVPAINVQSV